VEAGESEDGDIRHGGGVHKMAAAKKVELVGLAILKRYWRLEYPEGNIEDVHDRPDYFQKGIDLVLSTPREGKSKTVDAKVDTYIGTDPTRKIKGLCNPNSGFILMETISQLQFDRGKKDAPGWFYTSEADEIHYYYIALLNDARELAPYFIRLKDAAGSERSVDMIEDELIRILRVDQDLLVVYDLEEAREWLGRFSRNRTLSYSGAVNPTYVTVSVRVDRNTFCSQGPGRMKGPIFERVRRSSNTLGVPF